MLLAYLLTVAPMLAPATVPPGPAEEPIDAATVVIIDVIANWRLVFIMPFVYLLPQNKSYTGRPLLSSRLSTDRDIDCCELSSSITAVLPYVIKVSPSPILYLSENAGKHNTRAVKTTRIFFILNLC